MEICQHIRYKRIKFNYTKCNKITLEVLQVNHMIDSTILTCLQHFKQTQNGKNLNYINEITKTLLLSQTHEVKYHG